MLLKLLFLLIFFVYAKSYNPIPNWINNITVQLPEGFIQGGTVATSNSSHPLSIFLGVPFAEPPIGRLRFRAPEAVKSWSGVRSAHQYSRICMQQQFTPTDPTPGEDCLYLNVYTPLDLASQPNTLLPVMVWMHGGGLYFGSGSEYDGSDLARMGDVVVVTINYRLDVFGFLSTEDSASSGNFGFLDQQMAFKWVQRNIHKFGGDKSKVTIFGESGGSWAVSYQMYSYGSAGLFQRAIAQSGHGGDYIGVQYDARNRAFELGVLLNCTSHNSQKLIDCIRKVDAATCLAASAKQGYRYGMVNDGVFVNGSLDELQQQGIPLDIDIMTGVTEYEGWVTVPTLTTLEAFKINAKNTSYPTAFIDVLSRIQIEGDFPTLTPAVTQALLTEYTPYGEEDSFEAWVVALTNVLSDRTFNAPTEEFLKAADRSGRKPYSYYFTYRTEGNMSILGYRPPYIGAVHGAELKFLFNGTIFSNLYLTEQDLQFKKQIINIWTNFARNGNPEVAEGGKSWQPWSATHQNYLQLDFNITSKSFKQQLLPQRNAFWNQLIPTLEETGKKPCVNNTQSTAPEVQVAQGTLRGRRVLNLGQEREEFLGIPYARAPVGELRFRAPQEHRGWQGVRAASAFRARCVQSTFLVYDVTLRNDEDKKTGLRQEEDCLFVNIVVPGSVNKAKNSPLPVMVWIHGGGFIEGDALSPDGMILAPHSNVIVVTVAYRLGVFGFLSTGDHAAPGNWGLLDQQLALKWIHSNIQHFGGDPNKITIFGESAGGASVMYQVMNQESRQYFQRAIPQSGVPLNPWAFGSKNVWKSSVDIASAANCSGSSMEIVQCLRGLNASTLQGLSGLLSVWKPVVDGHFLKEPPSVLSAKGESKSIDILFGVNSAEGIAGVEYMLQYLNVSKSTSLSTNLTYELLQTVLTEVDGDFNQIRDAVWNQYFSQVEITYKNYVQNLVHLSSDLNFNAGILKFLDDHYNNGGTTYFYVFDHVPLSPIFEQSQVFRGSSHGEDLRFTFGFPLDPKAHWPFSREGKKVAELMTEMLTNFAKTGNPTASNLKVPLYTSGQKQYLLVNSASSIQTNFQPKAEVFWNEIVPALAQRLPIPCAPPPMTSRGSPPATPTASSTIPTESPESDALGVLKMSAKDVETLLWIVIGVAALLILALLICACRACRTSGSESSLKLSHM